MGKSQLQNPVLVLMFEYVMSFWIYMDLCVRARVCFN